eukprot:TRINITY_DN9200_c0_g1_i1.p1 TRINITY_DN9200_c0_g1~~TRINITY_DN9200_c0_g1_i1.p1  ORF type:complete len:247 (-),score=31.69 TRINITY_DN9200_c0_g1_i1:117-857(-)
MENSAIDISANKSKDMEISAIDISTRQEQVRGTGTGLENIPEQQEEETKDSQRSPTAENKEKPLHTNSSLEVVNDLTQSSIKNTNTISPDPRDVNSLNFARRPDEDSSTKYIERGDQRNNPITIPGNENTLFSNVTSIAIKEAKITRGAIHEVGTGSWNLSLEGSVQETNVFILPSANSNESKKLVCARIRKDREPFSTETIEVNPDDLLGFESDGQTLTSSLLFIKKTIGIFRKTDDKWTFKYLA